MTHPVLSEIHPLLNGTLKTLQHDVHHHTSCSSLISMLFLWNFHGKFVQTKGHLTLQFSKRYFFQHSPQVLMVLENHCFHSLFSHFVITSHVVYMSSPNLEVKRKQESKFWKQNWQKYIKLRCPMQSCDIMLHLKVFKFYLILLMNFKQ